MCLHCKGCREVARLFGEVEDLRQIMESMKRMVIGQGLEEKGGVRGDRVARVDEAEEKEKCEEVVTPDRRHFDRGKPEWKGDSGTKFIRR